MVTQSELYHLLFTDKIDFQYDINEIHWLLTQLMTKSASSSSLYLLITTLLSATQSFLAATTLDPSFIQKRANKRHQQLYKQVFDKIATILAIAEARLKGLTNEDDETKLLNNIINYCYKSILKRLLLLKNAQDIFYTQYWLDSNLHQLILQRKQPSSKDET